MTGNKELASGNGAANRGRIHRLFAYLVAAQTQNFRLAASLTDTNTALAPAGDSLVRRGNIR